MFDAAGAQAAATDRSPKTRYAVDEKMNVFIWIRWMMPDWLWDWMFPAMLRMALKGKGE